MMKYDIRITEHAKIRAWERAQMDASQLKYHAQKCLDDGIDALQDEVLRPLCLNKARKYNNSAMYLHQGNIYVFVEDILVTLFPLNYLNEFSVQAS